MLKQSIDFINIDPLSRILVLRMKLTPIKIAIYFLIFGLFWEIVIPLGSRVFQSSPVYFPPSIDGILIAFIEWPLMWAYYLWSKMQLSEMYYSILDNNLLGKGEKSKFTNFLYSTLLTSYSKKRIYFITAISAIILTLLQVWENLSANKWVWFGPNHNYIHVAIEMLVFTFSQYIVLIIATNELITIGLLKNFFDNFKINVHVNFPDRAGGWGEIGKHAIGFSLFAVVMGIWMTGMSLNQDTPTVIPILVKLIFWILFSLIAPTMFLIPTVSTHFAMAKHKYELLKSISLQIYKFTKNPSFESMTNEAVEQNSQTHLNELRNWYSYLDDSMRTWPFPKSTLPRIASSWFLPIVTGLASTFIQQFIKIK